jgi:hypothetical protein
MGNRDPRVVRSPGRWLAGLLGLALAALFLIPSGSLAAPAAASRVTVTPGATSGSLVANVSWDGTGISTAGSASSAFHISFGASVNLYYAWNQSTGTVGTSLPWSINDARLQIFYFGFAIGTRDVTTTTGQTSGHIWMSDWNTGPLQYVIEGTYQLTASLLASNGTTAWSQTFWVDVAAAYYVFAALPIVLIVLAAYELYSVATVGKQQALKSKRQGVSPPPPPASPPPTSPPPASEPPAATAPADAGSPSTADAPPPAGGAS